MDASRQLISVPVLLAMDARSSSTKHRIALQKIKIQTRDILRHRALARVLSGFRTLYHPEDTKGVACYSLAADIVSGSCDR